jgi:hypothetical protein
MTRKRRKFNKAVQIARKRKLLRERVRISKVLDEIGVDVTIKDIHRRTGLAEKNIRKIMLEHGEDITFLLLQRTGQKE